EKGAAYAAPAGNSGNSPCYAAELFFSRFFCCFFSCCIFCRLFLCRLFCGLFFSCCIFCSFFFSGCILCCLFCSFSVFVTAVFRQKLFCCIRCNDLRFQCQSFIQFFAFYKKLISAFNSFSAAGGIYLSHAQSSVDNAADTAVRSSKSVESDKHDVAFSACIFIRNVGAFCHGVVQCDEQIDLVVCLQHLFCYRDRFFTKPVCIVFCNDFNVFVLRDTFTETFVSVDTSGGTFKSLDLAYFSAVGKKHIRYIFTCNTAHFHI